MNATFNRVNLHQIHSRGFKYREAAKAAKTGIAVKMLDTKKQRYLLAQQLPRSLPWPAVQEGTLARISIYIT
jgi:hypothetical protein